MYFQNLTIKKSNICTGESVNGTNNYIIASSLYNFIEQAFNTIINNGYVITHNIWQFTL